MNHKHLLPLLVAPLCCWGEAPRDYTMIDLHNRLTTTMLELGKTSFTFSVEWPLDTEFDYGKLYLIGKLNLKRRRWSELEALRVDPTQGKATFEILYSRMPSSDIEYLDYSKKAFLAVRIPIESDSYDGPSRGRYEEDDEVDEDEDEVEADRSTSSHRNLWLYLGILCAVFGTALYFVRRKMKR